MYQPTLNEHFSTKRVSKSIKLIASSPDGLFPNRFQIKAETNQPLMNNISQSGPKRDHYQLMAKYCSQSSIDPKESIILHCTSKRENAKVSSVQFLLQNFHLVFLEFQPILVTTNLFLRLKMFDPNNLSKEQD